MGFGLPPLLLLPLMRAEVVVLALPALLLLVEDVVVVVTAVDAALLAESLELLEALTLKVGERGREGQGWVRDGNR